MKKYMVLAQYNLDQAMNASRQHRIFYSKRAARTCKRICQNRRIIGVIEPPKLSIIEFKKVD